MRDGGGPRNGYGRRYIWADATHSLIILIPRLFVRGWSELSGMSSILPYWEYYRSNVAVLGKALDGCAAHHTAIRGYFMPCSFDDTYMRFCYLYFCWACTDQVSHKIYTKKEDFHKGLEQTAPDIPKAYHVAENRTNILFPLYNCSSEFQDPGLIRRPGDRR